MGPANNVKVRLLFFISLLGIILIISAPVVSSVFVNLISPTETVPMGNPSSATVFVDSEAVVKDFYDLPNGTTFIWNVSVSGVSDLFTWQLNLTWDSTILNVSKIIPGEFLAQSVNQTSSEALGGVVINATNYVQGYSALAESILGNVSGISGSGRLVSIEFLVVGYGCSNLTINVGGTFPTMLLNSTGDSMEFTAVGGFFKNKLIGDSNGDGVVDILDKGKINAHWYPGPPVGTFGYSRCVDNNDDGACDILDRGKVNANWGRKVPWL